MPFQKNGKRDYKRELAWEKKREAQGKGSRQDDRSSRNQKREEYKKAGKVRVGDGKHVDHKDNNPRNNSKGNTRVVSAKTNLKKEANRKKRKS